MDDIPDWLKHWIALKAIEHYGAWFWNTHGKIWCQTANHELLRLYIWHCIMLAAILHSITAPRDQEEIEPATNYNAVAEAIRENLPSFHLELAPLAQATNSISESFKPYDWSDLVRNSFSDTFRQRDWSGLVGNSFSDILRQHDWSGLVRSGISESLKPYDWSSLVRNSIYESFKPYDWSSLVRNSISESFKPYDWSDLVRNSIYENFKKPK